MPALPLEGFDALKTLSATGMFANKLTPTSMSESQASDLAAFARSTDYPATSTGLSELDLEFEQTLDSYISHMNAHSAAQSTESIPLAANPPVLPLSCSTGPAAMTVTPAMMLPKYMSTLSMHTPPVTSSNGSPALNSGFPSPAAHAHASQSRERERFKSPGRSLSRERPSRNSASQVGKAPTSRRRSRSARRSAASAYSSAQPINIGHAGEGSRYDDNGWAPSEAGSTSASTSIVSSVPPMSSSSRPNRVLDNVAEESTASAQANTKPAHSTTDKKKRRRESHNAVERRRRDNINERIAELATLLPAVLLEEPHQRGMNEDELAGSPSSVRSPPGTPSLPLPALDNSPSLTVAPLPSRSPPRANKGTVLAKSVEYIRYLQQLVQLHVERNKDLERTIEHLMHGMSASHAVESIRYTRTGHGSAFDSSEASCSRASQRGTTFSPDQVDEPFHFDDPSAAGEETSRGRPSQPVEPRTGRSHRSSRSGGGPPHHPHSITASSTASNSSNALMLDGTAEFPVFDSFDWMSSTVAETKPFAFDGRAMDM